MDRSCSGRIDHGHCSIYQSYLYRNFKSIIAIKAGNAIDFLPSIRSQVTLRAAEVMRDAAVKAGAPGGRDQLHYNTYHGGNQ